MYMGHDHVSRRGLKIKVIGQEHRLRLWITKIIIIIIIIIIMLQRFNSVLLHDTLPVDLPDL